MVSDFSIGFSLWGERKASSMPSRRRSLGPAMDRGNGRPAIMPANDARGNLSIFPHDLF